MVAHEKDDRFGYVDRFIGVVICFGSVLGCNEKKGGTWWHIELHWSLGWNVHDNQG